MREIVAMLTPERWPNSMMVRPSAVRSVRSRTPAETARLGTERFLYLVQGSVAVTVGNAAYPLASGQGLYLDASVSHGMTNVGRSPAQCLSVLTPPML